MATALSLLEAVLDDQKVTYFIVPISSGRRLWSLATEFGMRNPEALLREHRAECQERVLSVNLEEAAAHARYLRTRFPDLIDPSRFVTCDWTQADYLALWKKVIDRWVYRVILAPGWAYSRGCLEECVEAYSKRLEVLSYEGEQLGLECANGGVDDAIAEAKSLDLHVPYLQKAKRALVALLRDASFEHK